MYKLPRIIEEVVEQRPYLKISYQNAFFVHFVVHVVIRTWKHMEVFICRSDCDNGVLGKPTGSVLHVIVCFSSFHGLCEKDATT